MKKLSAEYLYRLKPLNSAVLSPDEYHVLYSFDRVDKKTQKKYSNLWVMSTKNSRTRQFTYGDQQDSCPRWSPDGTSIAFLSNRKNQKQNQIFVTPFHGGEARPLTDMKGDFSTIEWSPDGKNILCNFRKKDKETVEREKDEQKKKLGIVSRHISRVFYKCDGEGYLPRERWHLWLVNAVSGKAVQLTDDPVYDEWAGNFDPSGKEVVFLSNRSKEHDLDPSAIDIYVLTLNNKNIRRITTPSGEKQLPLYSPDGKYIAYIGVQGKDEWWRNAHVWVVPASGDGAARDLLTGEDFTVSAWTINDIVGIPELSPPSWSPDGETIYFQVSHHGNTQLKSVSLVTSEVKTVVDLEGVVGSITFDRQGLRCAYFFSDRYSPGEIQVQEVKSKKVMSRTRVNRKELLGLSLGEIETHWIKTPAGTELQGWLFKPPDFSAEKKYPSILEVHGGPQVQYGNMFMFEFFYLAAQGYVVHFCNPRGSIGYGQDHTKAIWDNWGGPDYEDIITWTNFVARKPYIDTKRMGITGGSYGGDMTNWVIGKTRRFQAAVTQRCVSNLISMWGSIDANWYFQLEFGGKPPWENMENYWKQSPMSIVGNARTPTLIIHSEHDMRCAIEQGEQMFVALKKLGVDTEMVLFPDEPHGLSRSGRTDRRIERLHHIVRWFDRYLKQS